MEFFKQLFSTDFMPHGHCYMWMPEILWLHVLSDAAITLAYAAIPLGLIYFVKKRRDLQFKGVFILFGLFIFSCGMTHLLEVYSVWHGVYRLTGVVKAITAVISLATAGCLFRYIPKALALPSPQQLEDANRRLVQETNQRLQAEAALAQEQQEKLFQAIFDSFPGGMILVNRDSQITLSNIAANRMFGYQAQIMQQMSIHDLVVPGFREQHQQLLLSFFKQPDQRVMAASREVRALTHEGAEVDVEIALTPLDWREENFVIASVTDVSERNRQAEQLRKAHHRFDRTVAGTSDGLWEIDLVHRQPWYSPHFYRLLGLDPARDVGVDLNALVLRIHAEDRSEFQAALSQTEHNGLDLKMEVRLCLADDSERWFLCRAKRFTTDQGGFVSGSISDIHPRKLAEAELEEQTRFLNSIYDGIKHGIFVVDVENEREFRFAAFNRAEEELTGISFADARNKTLEDLVPKYFPLEVAKEIRGRYEACVRKRDFHEYTEMIPVMNREIWWLTNLTPMIDEHGQVYRIIGSATDITALKRMEAELRDREEYSRKIINYSLNGLYIFDLEQNKNIFINPSYTAITGYEIDDFAEMDGDMLSMFHPDHREDVVNHIQKVFNSESQAVYTIEYRFRHKKGWWIWCLSNDAVFSRDETGKPTQIIGTFIDITSIKAANERLLESNRELEQFAFIASHDLREPLRKVKSFGSLLTKRYADQLPEKGMDYLARMVSATERMDALVNDLLQLSRVATQAKAFETDDLSRAAELALNDLGRRIKQLNAQIVVEDLPLVACDFNQIYQVFLNLIGNALKYSKADESPRIRVSAVLDSQNFWRISVVDNGIGFDPEYAEKIFGIFSRLHSRDQYEGSGIGLSICRKIIERHSGTIWAEGRPGEGSTFIFTIPA